MAETRLLTLRPKSSPPPNCAICLGPYIDKCFSDPCMHQFCFDCLLKWSKIKAECPLCKQSFRLIIHNVKSNDEYDEHVVETNRGTDFHLPTEPARHQFHFRTTFTVDTRGEHAIQQMLLSHPLTRGQISFSNFSPRRRRRDVSSTNFRRSIYTNNMWVSAPPDVTGRYRDISPTYFRNYPSARQRLVPWLNRELNALLYENTMLVMYLVDRIMDYLLRHHICSRSFRLFLSGYLGYKAEHFVHEFYNFMRSPFDMIGYDRHIIYTTRPRSPTPYIEVDDNDNNSESEIIVVSDASSDVIETNPPTPPAPIVIELDSDDTIVESNDVLPSTSFPRPILLDDNDDRSPILPIKLRLKNKRKRKHRPNSKSKRRRRISRSSSSSSSTSSSDSYRSKRNYTIVNDVCVISSDDSDDDDNNSANKNSDSDDDLPLSALIRKTSTKALDLTTKTNVFDPNMPSCSFTNDFESGNSRDSRTPPLPDDYFNKKDESLMGELSDNAVPSCSQQQYKNKTKNKKRRSSSSSSVSSSSSSSSSASSSSSSSIATSSVSSSSDDSFYKKPIVKSEIHIKTEQGANNNGNNDGNDAGSSRSMVNIVIKNEEPSPLWYFP